MRAIITSVVVCLTLLVGAAFYFNWLNVSTARHSDGGKTEIKITVDQARAQADLAAAQEKARQALAGSKSIEGVVISADGSTIVVTESSSLENFSALIQPDTKIQIDEKPAKMDEIKPGDVVTLTYDLDEDSHKARSVLVKRRF